MSRNGLGTYSRVPGSAYTNGTTNDGSELDAEMNDIATALTDSLTANGEKTWAANQKAGTYKVTGLGAGSASTDSVNLGQVQAQAYAWLTSVSGTDTITASASPAITAYADGQTFRFIPANTNTGAATINISGVGAKSLTKSDGSALAASDLVAGAIYEIVYDGTKFQVYGVTAYAATSRSKYAQASQVQDSTLTYLTAVAGTDTITATAALSMSAYAPGQMFHFLGAGSNTGAATLNINAIGAKPIILATGDVLLAGEIESGKSCVVIYDGTSFRLMQARTRPQLQTSLATTSGTQKLFSSVPSWVKRITMTLAGVSGTSTGRIYARIGTGGTPETSGYIGSVTVTTASSAVASSPAGFSVQESATAASSYSGVFTITKHSGNTWIGTFVGEIGGGAGTYASAGRITLSGALDCVSLEIASGTFDAGSVNVSWE